MERLVYMLNREWPKTNSAVRMLERICTGSGANYGQRHANLQCAG